MHEFVQTHRAAVVARARKRIAERIAPLATRDELDHGVNLFLDDLVAALEPSPSSSRAPGTVALQNGFTVAQVVYDFGDICQAITAEISEQDLVIDAREFRILNQCLDDAIASAVTEFARRQQRRATDRRTEQLTTFADQLRPLLSAALLAFEMVQRGSVGAGGSTGALVGRSLRAIRKAIDSTLAIARLDRDAAVREPIVLATLLEDLEVSAAIEAKGRGIRLAIARPPESLVILGDRDILSTALASLIETAIQTTARDGTVGVRVGDGDDMTKIDIDGGFARDGDRDALLLAERGIGACGGTLVTDGASPSRKFLIALPRADGAAR